MVTGRRLHGFPVCVHRERERERVKGNREGVRRSSVEDEREREALWPLKLRD